MGRTVRDFSAHWAPPSALRIEKHEQFTPTRDVNLRRLVLIRLNFGGFSESRNKDKVQVYYVLTLCSGRAMHLVNQYKAISHVLHG